VRVYLEKYIAKYRIPQPLGYGPRVPLPSIEQEIRFMKAAGEYAVEVLGTIRMEKGGEIIGFIMPRLKAIDPKKLDPDQKRAVFDQMRRIVPALHTKGIVHGDIKLTNMLLTDDGRLVLCDFGAAAFIDKVHYPIIFSVPYVSSYRLDLKNYNPFLPEEDFYALGVSVWQLFTEEIPFEGMDLDGGGNDLEAKIRSGLTVDVDRVEDQEVMGFIIGCLNAVKQKQAQIKEKDKKDNSLV
jgi:serine/threonine protein kinase